MNNLSNTILKSTPKTGELDSKLLNAKIDLTVDLPKPPIAWGMVDPKNPNKPPLELGYLGDFSLIIGKAKSKKTFFTGIAIASAVSGQTIAERYKGFLPNDQKTVLYFDTEQGKYHAQQSVKRICRQIGVCVPLNLHAYGLRPFSPKERVELITYAIESIKSVGFIVIDGIRDLVNSINDEAEATEISSMLLKWSQLKNLHIITVLHQNKGDNNARGHLGTELMNKAATVLSVTKSEHDVNISIVESVACRDIEPEIFAFEIDVDGLPVAVENYKIRSDSKYKKTSLLELPLDDVYSLLLNEVFKKSTEVKYSELVSLLKTALIKVLNITAGDNKVKDLVTLCKHNGLVIQEKEKMPYKLGELTST